MNNQIVFTLLVLHCLFIFSTGCHQSITYPPETVFYSQVVTIGNIKYDEPDGAKNGYYIKRIVLTNDGTVKAPLFHVDRPQKTSFGIKQRKHWCNATWMIFLEQNRIELPVDNNIRKYYILIRPISKIENRLPWRIWKIDPKFLSDKPLVLHVPRMKDLKTLDKHKDSKTIQESIRSAENFLNNNNWVE